MDEAGGRGMNVAGGNWHFGCPNKKKMGILRENWACEKKSSMEEKNGHKALKMKTIT